MSIKVHKQSYHVSIRFPFYLKTDKKEGEKRREGGGGSEGTGGPKGRDGERQRGLSHGTVCTNVSFHPFVLVRGSCCFLSEPWFRIS